MGSGYIADGHTRNDGYIADGPKSEGSGESLYEALEFSYRPASRREVIKLDAMIKVATRNEATDADCVDKGEMLACEFVAKRIVSWNLKADGVQDVPITADSMSRLTGSLFANLYGIVRGERFNDAKPEAEPDKTTIEADQKN